MTTTNDTTAPRPSRWLATDTIIWPERKADRSRNGRRIPRSVKHRGMR